MMKKLTTRILTLSSVLIAALFMFQFSAVQSASETPASESPSLDPALSVATFAGGCFWCVESRFEKLDGVHEAISGYTGGHLENPTYKEVGRGQTGHTEAVQVYYDPTIVSYEALLHNFWREIDPTDAEGQFADRGSMYRPAIFYHNEREKIAAIDSRDELDSLDIFEHAIVVEILPAEPFYEAEDYHQNYHLTNSLRYKLYRHGSGRDQFLNQVWGDAVYEPYKETSLAKPEFVKPSKSEIKAKLSERQYYVTQEDGTEPPFRNEFWDSKEAGIYVDIVSGEPLFSSTDKFKSGTGWPSFTRPISDEYIVEKTDYILILPRTEVRSKYGDSHLGHVFNDGPDPTGLRYCINSAALRFVPEEKLEIEGYEQFASLFE